MVYFKLVHPYPFTGIQFDLSPILLQIFLNHPCLHLPHMNCLNYLCFVSEELNVVPKNWALNEDERVFLAVIQTTEQKSYVLEQETVKQSLCKLWKNSRKNRIASTNGHRVLIRKRDFEALGKLFLNPNLGSDLPAAARSINLISMLLLNKVQWAKITEKFLFPRLVWTSVTDKSNR